MRKARKKLRKFYSSCPVCKAVKETKTKPEFRVCKECIKNNLKGRKHDFAPKHSSKLS